MNSCNDHNCGPSADSSHRFLFDDARIRGEIVHLEGVFQDILRIHQYPPGVSSLLGEFLCATALLSSTLKFEGKLILQARSEGEVPLIMVECSNTGQLRAIVQGAAQATSSAFGRLLANGQLAITVDPVSGRRYQSVVPLSEKSLAHSLDAYFQQSEQLPTRFWLASDGQRAAGMLLQQMPARNAEDDDLRADQWHTACSLAATLSSAELLECSTETLLHRLFHEHPLRLFDASPLVFHCSCSRERTLQALASLGHRELTEILAEQGSITMDCEFCNSQYRFSEQDLTPVLTGKKGDSPPATVH